MRPRMEFAQPAQVQLGGILGEALAANRAGRLMHFVEDENSPAIALFHPRHVHANEEGDWYGEHAGKWLYAAARAANRTSDAQLAARVHRVASYLASVQDKDGYLGTYAPHRRFMHAQPLPAVETWDGAPSQRTWDIWTHSYMILGLLEVHRYFPTAAYLEAACRMGDLCWRTLSVGEIDITRLGNHHGMSATVLLDAAVELYFATSQTRYLDLARTILRQAEQRRQLRLLSQISAGVDAADIGTGKAYQLCWNLVGIAKLARASDADAHIEGVERVWESIRAYHLTLGGGPWGGVVHRSREVFNHQSVFSPAGYVETCSILAWLQLNRELLHLTGEAKYAEQIEQVAFNDLLGAQAPNGEDWCYYSFPNGRRVHTTYWRCCKSSGSMALEELPSLAYAITPEPGVAINFYGPSTARLALPSLGDIHIEQRTQYPFDGAVRIRVTPEQPAEFTVRLRIPSWAHGAAVRVNGLSMPGDVTPGTFMAVERAWRAGDEIELQLPMSARVHERSSSSVQQSRAPDGSPIEQEVMRYDYIAMTRGPLVYATGLIDGFKSAETLRVPAADRALLEEQVGPDGHVLIRLNASGRAPLTFVPYYLADGRSDGGWRLTWMQVVRDSAT